MTLIFVNWNLISECLRTIEVLSREPIPRVGVLPEICQPAVDICLGSAIGKVDFLHNKV